MKFNDIALSQKILDSLKKIKYESLTPIQEAVIPNVMEGKDVLGCSQTGSGKTGAFLIPILSKLLESKTDFAIIVAPTRELAMQIFTASNEFSDNCKEIKKTLLIGGSPMGKQLIELKNKPRLVIGTPGRINDHLKHGKLRLENFSTFVLDEMDRMLDMGFSVQINEILEFLPKERQVLLFSATMSKKIELLTKKYQRDPIVIKVGETNQPSINIKQEILNIEDRDKFKTLLEKVRCNTTKFALVFVKTKDKVDLLQEQLFSEGLLVEGIHGGLRQAKREKIIRNYRSKKFNVLIATDVAARGLDIHHIDTVINYDLPDSPEDYIHRIGRCSRGIDITGLAISFISKRDVDKWFAIKSLIKDGDYEEPQFFKKKDFKKDSKKIPNKKFKNKHFEEKNNFSKRGNKKTDYRKRQKSID